MPVFYGVAGHSPDEVIKALLSFDSNPTFKIIKPKSVFTAEGLRKTKYIICLSREDFVRNYKILCGLKQKVFVFASPLFLLEYKGFNRLDYGIDSENKTRIVVFDEIDLEVLSNPVEKPIQKKKVTYLDIVIQKAKSGSVFDKLMTYIYKLPAKTHQKPVKKICCQFLRNDWSKEKLIEELKRLGTQIKLSSAIVSGISDILFSDIARRYQIAFKEINGVPDVADVSTAYDLNPYEFMYILKMLESDKQITDKSKVSIDTYLANEKKGK
jgi:hypothetical protein